MFLFIGNVASSIIIILRKIQLLTVNKLLSCFVGGSVSLTRRNRSILPSVLVGDGPLYKPGSVKPQLTSLPSSFPRPTATG
jgi:hypothetical protein